MYQIDLDTLKHATESLVAIRSITRLEPAGGPGDKVFPPTYMKEGKAETKYAMEERQIDGNRVLTVLLDSVQSQANRMEEALLEGWRRKELHFPLVQVDFSKEEGLADLEQITALQTPHRIADALLRDSLYEGKLFRMTKIGQAFTDARPNHATGMYKYCPTALLFGIWDSTGPKGGLGAKFQRCVVSEIIGVDVVAGVKTSSRIDPVGIVKNDEIYEHADPDQKWTQDPKEARTEKGRPVLLGGREGKGTPTAINHANIPPTIDHESGGVTMGHAVQTTVLSLAGLRRLRFTTDIEGQSIPTDRRDSAEHAARTALAALGLAAIVYQRENDYDLRSRSLLVAKQPLVFQLLDRNGEVNERTLDRETAAKLLGEASAWAGSVGLGWNRDPVTLVPAPKLSELIRRSRARTQAGDAEAGE